MKKLFILSILTCLLCFTGCNKEAKIENTNSSIENKESIIDSNNFTEAENELYTLLSEISSNVELGTAGSSLKAVKYTSNLMNWSIGTSLTNEQISNVIKAKINNLDSAQNEEFVSQMSLLENTYKELLGPSRNELLETSGNNDNHAWIDVLNNEITTLENIDYLFNTLKSFN